MKAARRMNLSVKSSLSFLSSRTPYPFYIQPKIIGFAPKFDLRKTFKTRLIELRNEDQKPTIDNNI